MGEVAFRPITEHFSRKSQTCADVALKVSGVTLSSKISKCGNFLFLIWGTKLAGLFRRTNYISADHLILFEIRNMTHASTRMLVRM